MSQPDPHLTDQQHAAITLLVAGHSDREVADRVGVARETVNRWRNRNPHVMAELSRRRQDAWREVRDRLRALAGQAVDVLRDGLLANDTRAAVTLLKGLGVLQTMGPPTGPTTAEDALAHLARRAAAADLERTNDGTLDGMLASMDDGLRAAYTQQHVLRLRAAWPGLTPESSE